MVLTDREIQAAIQTQQIVINPAPDDLAYSSTSLDLTLSKQIRIWKPVMAGVDQLVSPGAKGYSYNAFVQQYSDPKEIGQDGYILESKAFILGWTEENLTLPVHSRLAARVEGKSSLARLGIGVHITAPTVHAGFRGPIQLEICNNGTLRVKLIPGMPVCQLIFEQTLGTPDKGYKGQFYSQKAI